MKEKIQQLAARFYPQVVAIRRELHANPELSYEEKQTAALVGKTLSSFGIAYTTGIAKTGVVALIKGRNPHKRCIALRADMDALPIEEKNTCSYRSKNAGVMHACGHDVHTANLLGAAMILSELKEEWEGTIKLIFQPSEEKMPSGAHAMIDEGVMNNPKIDAIYGLHVHTELEAGQVGFRKGNFMASADEIYIAIKGKGGHAAQPSQFISPLLIAAEILLALRPFTDMSVPTVLSFGKIIANGATNIIPEKAELAGTLRCFDEKKRAHILNEIKRICTEIATKSGGSCDLTIPEGHPVLVNDEELTSNAILSAIDYMGAEKIHELPIRMGAEDFAYYSQLVPACFYRIGVANKEKGITSAIHTATFDIDEQALLNSIGLMAWLAIQ